MRYEIPSRKDASFMLPSYQKPATFLTHAGIKLPVYSIMTLNEFELVFPEESVAVQTTSVVPIGNTEPDA